MYLRLENPNYGDHKTYSPSIDSLCSRFHLFHKDTTPSHLSPLTRYIDTQFMDTIFCEKIEHNQPEDLQSKEEDETLEIHLATFFIEDFDECPKAI